MMLFLAWAAAALGAAPAAPAAAMAPHGSAEYDVQCMLAMQGAAGRVDAASREKVGLVMMFYFGRVDSALSGAALKQRMLNAGKTLQGRQLGPILQDCANFMNQRGHAMDTVRQQLAPTPKPAGK